MIPVGTQPPRDAAAWRRDIDVVAHRLDGLEVVRALKSNPHTCDIPIVVVTDTDIKDLNLADVACLLRKPLDTRALVVAIHHLVRQTLAAPPRGLGE